MGSAGSIFIGTMGIRTGCQVRILASTVNLLLIHLNMQQQLISFVELDLPEYESYETLRQQVYTAMTAGSEYFGFA